MMQMVLLARALKTLVLLWVHSRYAAHTVQGDSVYIPLELLAMILEHAREEWSVTLSDQCSEVCRQETVKTVVHRILMYNEVHIDTIFDVKTLSHSAYQSTYPYVLTAVRPYYTIPIGMFYTYPSDMLYTLRICDVDSLDARQYVIEHGIRFSALIPNAKHNWEQLFHLLLGYPHCTEPRVTGKCVPYVRVLCDAIIENSCELYVTAEVHTYTRTIDANIHHDLTRCSGGGVVFQYRVKLGRGGPAHVLGTSTHRWPLQIEFDPCAEHIVKPAQDFSELLAHICTVFNVPTPPSPSM